MPVKPMVRFRVPILTGLAFIVVMSLCPLSYGQNLTTRVLDFLGISATPGAQRGVEAEFSGDIWVAELDTGTRSKLTQEGGYRSPVFTPGDEGILALKGDDLWFVPLSGGEPEKRATLPGAMKLVGFHKQDKDKLLVLFKGSRGAAVGILSLKDGKVSPVPYGSEDISTLNHLRGWERVYGNTTVREKIEHAQEMGQNQEWTDAYLDRGADSPRNISRCKGTNCGQPSLSFDGDKVVYIKAQSQEPR